MFVGSLGQGVKLRALKAGAGLTPVSQIKHSEAQIQAAKERSTEKSAARMPVDDPFVIKARRRREIRAEVRESGGWQAAYEKLAATYKGLARTYERMGAQYEAEIDKIKILEPVAIRMSESV